MRHRTLHRRLLALTLPALLTGCTAVLGEFTQGGAGADGGLPPQAGDSGADATMSADGGGDATVVTPPDASTDTAAPRDGGTDTTIAIDSGSDGTIAIDSGSDGTIAIDSGTDGTVATDGGQDATVTSDAAADGPPHLDSGSDAPPPSDAAADAPVVECTAGAIMCSSAFLSVCSAGGAWQDAGACPGPASGSGSGTCATSSSCGIECISPTPSSCVAGSCTNVTTDPHNCGACGHDCTLLPHIGDAAAVTCASGACVIPVAACATGYDHCSSSPDAGCETPINANPNCGGCDPSCSVPYVCTASGATYACASDCTGSTPNTCPGACVNFANDQNNCGGCGLGCDGGTTCIDGGCGGQCGPTQVGCSGNVPWTCVGGVETPSTTCGTNATCFNGSCVGVCEYGETRCVTIGASAQQQACTTDGGWVETSACSPPSAGSGFGFATCSGSSCALGCDAGSHLCATACESNTDPSNCGAGCGTDCPGPTTGAASGVPSCNGTSCTVACNTANGYSPCGTTECVLLGSDPANCGICGRGCSLGCSDGGCVTVTDVAVDYDTTCAVLSNGNVYCWGWNPAGVLGPGTTAGNSATPIQVPLPSAATAVALGEEHACALLSTGQVACWGDNSHGQLGPSSDAGSSTAPVTIASLAGVTAISAGEYNTCAITGGKLACWGDNTYGQIGYGTASAAPMRTPTYSLTSGVTSVSAGSTTCAIASGAAHCWGLGTGGQIGNGTTANNPSPQAVTTLTSGVTGLWHGGEVECALASGPGYCWGVNANGEFGNGGTSSAAVSTPQSNTYGKVAMAVGVHHACIVNTGGTMACAGDNTWGQLGIGSTAGSSDYDYGTVSGISGATIVASGPAAYHTCAIVASGATLMCWGANNEGQLGAGYITSSATPTTVPVAVALP